MLNVRFFAAALCLAGAVTAAVAGERSAPAKVQAAQAPVTTQAVVIRGDGGCGCDGGFGSGRTTFAERRAARVESRSAKRGACCGSCATTEAVITETPAVIRTESIYRTQKVGQKTVIVPANQATTGKAGK